MTRDGGNLLAKEVVRRFWEGTLHGGYLPHGETYYDERDLIWWSKGGTLCGDSPARIAFLRDIVEACPTGRIDVIDTWDMTVTPLPGTHTGTVRVDPPAKPYTLIRLRRAEGPAQGVW